jgi:hypothetical protein
VRKTSGQPRRGHRGGCRPSGVAHSTVPLLVAVIVVLVLAQKLLPANVTIGDTPLQ